MGKRNKVRSWNHYIHFYFLVLLIAHVNYYPPVSHTTGVVSCGLARSPFMLSLAALYCHFPSPLNPQMLTSSLHVLKNLTQALELPQRGSITEFHDTMSELPAFGLALAGSLNGSS